MGVYRVETSPNNRAGCINKECKAAGVKILKGEFRYAIQVTIKEHTSWQYKHWGCVTPKQIDNLIETSGGDTEMVDGYDELPEEYQEKVRFALENGHVPDEDWKGDIEANRDGHSGMRLTKAELKKKEKDAGEDLDGENPKKRGKKAENEDDNEEKPQPSKKKNAKVVKNEDDAEDAPAPKKRGRVKMEAGEGDEAPAPKKARAARGKKVEYKEEDDDEDEAPSKKKKMSKSKSKAQKFAADSEAEAEHEEDDEIEEEEEAAPKPKRGRKNVANGGAKAPQKRGNNKATANDE